MYSITVHTHVYIHIYMYIYIYIYIYLFASPVVLPSSMRRLKLLASPRRWILWQRPQAPGDAAALNNNGIVWSDNNINNNRSGYMIHNKGIYTYVYYIYTVYIYIYVCFFGSNDNIRICIYSIYIHITSIQWIFITITQRAVVLLGQYIHIRLLMIIGCTYLPPAYLT